LRAAPARWAIIGAGGGTTARLIDRIYSDAEIHGVELDPLVVEVGERFFDPPKENYTVSVQDGRGWIHTTDEIFDYFCIDAYRQPYVPFELTTIEFFSEVSDHLSENGALTINVASPRSDHALVNVLCSTLAEVFPSVFYFRLPSRSSATIVVATKQPTTIEDYQRNAKLSQPFEKALVIIAGSRITNQYTKVTAYTDDHAPAERLMDLMVLREIRERSGKQ
jgi:spermidine synthase